MASTPSRLTSDNQEQLRVTGTGGSGGNVNITGINGTAPALNNPLPVELSDGTNSFGTAGNPLSVNVISGGGSNASVGLVGGNAPTSATEIGVVDSAGKLRAPSGFVLTNSTPQAVAIVDANGNQITSFGGGTQYADGTTQATPTGTVALGKNPSNILHSLALDAGGNLLVNVAAGGTSGVQYPLGNSPGTPTGTLAVMLTDAGVVASPRLDAQNALRVVVNNNSPIEHVMVDPESGSPAKVDDDGALFVRLQNQNDETILLSTNTFNWGGVPVTSATATPQGTELSPVTRSFSPKVFRNISNVPPPISSTVYYGPNGISAVSQNAGWFDTQQTGATQLEISFAANTWQATGNDGVYVDTCDDPATLLTRVLGAAPGQGLQAQFGTFSCALRQRYWQIRYINGAVTPTSLFLSSSEWAGVASVSLNPNSGAQVLDGSGFNDTTSNTYTAMAPNFSVGGIIRFAPLAIVPFLGTNASTGPLSVQRTPNIFKTAQVSLAGVTAVWTPTAGKKFRLMRYQIQLTDNAAPWNGGVITVTFFDAASSLNISYDFYIPASAAAGNAFVSPWCDLGNGIISAAANNVLGANLSMALQNGNFRINVCGTEE